jgi:ribosomal protein L12E/L44/L45/RPP1/RPP2
MRRKNRNKKQKTQFFTRSNAAVQPRTETYEQPTDASPVAPESLMSEPVWTDIDNRQPKRGLRIFAVVVALIVTVIIAIGAGGLLAMVDLEIKPHDLYGAVTGKDVDEAVQAAQEEYESIFAAASEKITVDLGEYEAEEPADEAQTSEEAGEDTEEDTKKTEFAIGASSEIAGIGEVISAGTNDIIVYKPAADGSSAPSTTVINDPNANYPLPFSTVDLSYFDDALFIGDSRMLGFGMYSGLTNATFYAVTSFSIFRYETMPVVQTPNGKVPIFDALPYDQFTKVYIKVGLNELGGSDASFIKVYDEFVTKIRQMEPRAIIYTHAILPVTAEKSRTDHTHSNENINARNEALKQYAEEHQCYYIDIKPVVSEPDGSLMPEMAGDGIHLKAGYMELWKEYLRTHAVIF